MSLLRPILKWILSLFCGAFVVQSIKILTIGDSIDRFAVYDYCDGYGGTMVDWTDEKLTYFEGAAAGTICNLPNGDSLAHLQIFGGNDTGPYWRSHDLATPNNILDTKDRVKHGLELYFRKFPAPDFVYYHTGMWDLHYYLLVGGNTWYTVNTVGHEDYNRSIAQADRNYRNRLKEMRSVVELHGLQNITRIAFRTATYFPTRASDNHCEKDGKFLIAGHNHLLRRISRELDVSFHDYDADMWESVDYDFSRCDVLRDAIHPSPSISLAHARKIMGYQYSNHVKVRGPQLLPRDFSLAWRHPDTKVVLKKAYLIKYIPHRSKNLEHEKRMNSHHNHSVYFVTYDDFGQNPVKHANASHAFQRLFRLSVTSDAVTIGSIEELDSVPSGNPVPAAFNDPNVALRGVVVRIIPGSVSTLAKLMYEYFLVIKWEKRQIVRSGESLFDRSFDIVNSHETLKGLPVVELHRNFLEYLALGSPLVLQTP